MENFTKNRYSLRSSQNFHTCLIFLKSACHKSHPVHNNFTIKSYNALGGLKHSPIFSNLCWCVLEELKESSLC